MRQRRSRPREAVDENPDSLRTDALLAVRQRGRQRECHERTAPTGKLRVALVFAPSMSIFFVVKERTASRSGVTADIAEALGKKLNVPVERVLFPNSGLAIDALEAGKVDVSFMPVDEERKKRIAFGPDYVLRRKHLHGDRRVAARRPSRTWTRPACG